MKIYAKVSSIEKKEIMKENAQGKREKKLIHILKAGTIDGITLTLKSDESYWAKEFAVGSMLNVNLTMSQKKIEDSESKEAEA